MNQALRVAMTALALGAAATSVSAQDWTGGYVGLHVGQAQDPDDSGSDRFLFDTNLDNNFSDTVNTAAGADAFSPGFCNGAARGPTPADGCSANEGGTDWGVRGGYDWQTGHWVFGVVGEYAMSDVRDAVSAFSTTPAFYTMHREVDDVFALRARAGFTFGDGDNLVYATTGWVHAKVETAFTTSNGVNAFSDNGGDSVDGQQYGLGYERRLGDSFTVGLEYLMTDIDDDGYRVQVGPGTAPATNPFLIVNPAGTELRRSDTDLSFDSLRLTASYRF